MTDTHTDDLAKAKAEATFKRKEAQAREGAKAMADYLAGQKAEHAKTARLRALRLAKEAADAKAAEAAPTARGSAKRKAG